MLEFAGQVVVVSGAAQGIGAAVVAEMAAQGALLALLDQQDCSAQVAQLDAAGVRAINIVLDISASADVAQAIAQIEAELGPIAVLIHAAGILQMGSLLHMDEEAWDRLFAVNVKGCWLLCRACANAMAARQQGAIVSISSNAAHVPRLQMGAYAASKAAHSHLLRCLGLELAALGIRCNSVAPGSTLTPMQQQLWDSTNSAQEVIAGSLANYRLGIPLARMAEAADIAQAACFLASTKARHITMQELVVDGGATLGV
ncbi:MAG: 2,3-dihydro-2,3-dihydroxybenzoate dehydrogenase [Burkholderiales bacterium]|nr:2,3-dihydro-2,3-dihydroxybenzoate dehydrogenase [Burkholderiales bacterium]